MPVPTLSPPVAVIYQSVAVVKVSFFFSFALDLKSEIKKGIILQNVLSILLGKLVGTGSTKN
jgi:hypothetical protein